jgi:Tfp pilus assembly protein PilX
MRHTFRLRRQAGVGIVTAIFLLVVLAGLGVAMVGI